MKFFWEAGSRNALLFLSLCGSPFLLSGCSQNVAVRPAINPDQAASEIFREDKSFELGKNIASVEIENRYGEINVRDHDEAEVGVHAVGQLMQGSRTKAHLVASRKKDTLLLTVVAAAGESSARYDMAVFVSKDMPLVIHGGRFRVDARKRNARLAITTVSGNINASSHTAIELSTDSGTIQAAQLNENWYGVTRLRSETGRIVALAPLSGNVSLSAETGGRLSTNFGLSVHARPQGGYQANAQYGTGASQWRIESRSGEIILEQAVILGEDVDSAEDSD